MQEARDLLTIALFDLTKAMWPRFPAAAWQAIKQRILGKDIPDDLLQDEQLFILHEALLNHKKTLEARHVTWAAARVPEEA